MKLFKNWIFWGLIVSIIGVVAGYVFKKPTTFGLCLQSEPSCALDFIALGHQLFYPFMALAIIFLVLLFVPQAVRAWRKFAWCGVPLGAFLVYATVSSAMGGGFQIFPPAQVSVLIITQTYVGISLGIIALARFNTWRIEKQNTPFSAWWWYVLASLGGMAVVTTLLPPVLQMTGVITPEVAGSIGFFDALLLFFFIALVAGFNLTDVITGANR